MGPKQASVVVRMNLVASRYTAMLRKEKKEIQEIAGWLGFYDISTHVCYLMQNPVYIYIDRY